MPKQKPTEKTPQKIEPNPDAEEVVKPEDETAVEVDDSIRANVRDKLFSRLLGEDEPEKKDDEADQVTPEGEEEPEKPEQAEKPKPAKKKAAKPKEEPEPEDEDEPEADPAGLFDEDKLARAISSGNEKLVQALQKQKEQPKEQDEIPEVVAKKAHLYDKLSELYPDKYKSLTSKMVKFAKQEAQKAAEYEQETGEEFDPNDSKHDAWYTKNMPKVDPEDLDEARIEIRVEKKLEKLNTSSNKEVEEVRRELRERDYKSEAHKIKEQALAPLLAAIDPEYVEKPLEDLEGEDRIAYKVVTSEVERIYPFLETIAKLERRIVDFDEKDQDHMQVLKLLNGMEEAIGGIPDKKRVRDGKQWASRKEWQKMTKAQRNAHWIVTEEDMRNNVMSYVGNQAKSKYDEYMDLIGDARPTTKKSAKPKSDQAKKELPSFMAPKETEDDDDPPSSAPSVRSKTQINQPESLKAKEPKTGKELFMERLLGG